MATILFTWELGAGLGHYGRLQPLTRALCEMGHRVYFALRDVRHASVVFADTPVTILQAPFKIGLPDTAIDPPRTFAHILHNVGFAHASELLSMVQAWRGMYDLVRPDLLVFDHSPTAMLASRGGRNLRLRHAMTLALPSSLAVAATLEIVPTT